MKTVARFVTRRASKPGTSPEQTDVFIGVMAKADAHLLKPNTVYQIREIMGELMIEEVGPSVMDTGVTGFTWGKDMSALMRECGSYMYLTADEYAEQCAKKVED